MDLKLLILSALFFFHVSTFIIIFLEKNCAPSSCGNIVTVNVLLSTTFSNG